jgi:hypothetical protein
METLVQEETKKVPDVRHFSRQAWLARGDVLLQDAMASDWQIGDWALATPAEASLAEVRELLEEAAARTGYELKTIRAKRRVAERIPLELRGRPISFYGYNEIAQLTVRGANGKTDEDKTLALRADFVEKFAAEPNATVLAIRDAIRAKMGLPTTSEMKNVTFKLTAEDFARLTAVVEADPTHETASNLVCELVLKFISEREASL